MTLLTVELIEFGSKRDPEPLADWLFGRLKPFRKVPVSIIDFLKKNGYE